jgi:AmmeMemoRadiSam system protein B
MSPIREPAVAGHFYPGSAPALSASVEALLGSAPPAEAPPVRPVALVAPHAGYVYSGGVAASAYRLLSPGAFDRVVIIAPSHRVPFPGSSIWPRGAYRTPLGLVPIDEDLAERVLREARGEVVVEPELHRGEHSLEVQLPFLQATLGKFRLVPIVMGRQEEPHPTRLGEAVAAAVSGLGPDARALLVASTDLSHYHSDERARSLDGVLIDGLARLDADAVARDLGAGRCEACGGGPLVATLRAARALGATRAEVLSYATSGDVSGDREEVVGYVAAALLGPGGAA